MRSAGTCSAPPGWPARGSTSPSSPGAAAAPPRPRTRGRGGRPGALVADASDVIRFAVALAEPWTEALRQPLARPVGGVYGLGFFGERVAGADVWGHGGSYGGFQSSLLLVPSEGAVFVGLTSSGEGSRALRELEDLWFERLLGTRRAVAEVIRAPGGGARGACRDLCQLGDVGDCRAKRQRSVGAGHRGRARRSSCGRGRSASARSKSRAARSKACGSISRSTGSHASGPGWPPGSRDRRRRGRPPGDGRGRGELCSRRAGARPTRQSGRASPRASPRR